MNQSDQNSATDRLTEKDIKYLQHIAQVLKINGQETFKLDELTPAWLTTDELHASAAYWRKSDWARVLGAIVGIIVAGVLGFAGLISILFFGTISAAGGNTESAELFILSGFSIGTIFLIAVVVFFTLVIGHVLASSGGKKDVRFDPEPLQNKDRSAIRKALEKADCLPKQQGVWLFQMVRLGIISQDDNRVCRILNSELIDVHAQPAEEGALKTS